MYKQSCVIRLLSVSLDMSSVNLTPAARKFGAPSDARKLNAHVVKRTLRAPAAAIRLCAPAAVIRFNNAPAARLETPSASGQCQNQMQVEWHLMSDLKINAFEEDKCI